MLHAQARTATLKVATQAYMQARSQVAGRAGTVREDPPERRTRAFAGFFCFFAVVSPCGQDFRRWISIIFCTHSLFDLGLQTSSFQTSARVSAWVRCHPILRNFAGSFMTLEDLILVCITCAFESVFSE